MFNFDEPDNWLSYISRNSKKSNNTGNKKTFDGVLMFWVCLCLVDFVLFKHFPGVLVLQKTKTFYKDLLFLPLLLAVIEEDFILQQDNCIVHTAQSIKNYSEFAELRC